MKYHVKEYKEKLGKLICDYMDRSVMTEGTAISVNNLCEAWDNMCELEKKMEKGSYMTRDEATEWVDGMRNADGTMGAHWAITDTTAVAEAEGVVFTHITDWCWWATMNMMYSDYCSVAAKNNVNTPKFFAEMSKAFLFDPDGPGPKEKLSAYYNCVSKM